MQGLQHIAVIDIGKSNAKVAIVDKATGGEFDLRKQPNPVCNDGLYPHHDTVRLWNFILESLKDLASRHRIDAISITTHGVTAALVDDRGELALPVLDYEHDGPDKMRPAYDTIRPDFAESGSPALPVGLNLGAQFFWLQKSFPEAFANTRTILTYPQYWAYRLSGVSAFEATSFGCHTDLWAPKQNTFSSLMHKMGWLELMPPRRSAFDCLGPVTSDVALATGLDPACPVFCGIHDSNASLLPHLLRQEKPFAVVSTGTWVIAMSVGGKDITLDPAKDTLFNVNAEGNPVASARFMGGREYEMLMQGRSGATWTDADVGNVLSTGFQLMPLAIHGSGPFRNQVGQSQSADAQTPGMQHVAASFYLACTTAHCLDVIGAQGEIIVEGPFGANALYLEMLATASARQVSYQPHSSTGTSLGAAMLAWKDYLPAQISASHRVNPNAAWADYARRWIATALT